MKNQPTPKSKIILKKDLGRLIGILNRLKKKIIFTNGVFDLLHRGHVEYLNEAKKHGDCLIVGLNSDTSVKRLKGNKRPIQPQADRAIILASLFMVDYVVVFSEDTPENLIKRIKPSVLVKGADYKESEIVGAEFVKKNKGVVKRIRLTKNRSTSKLIKRMS